MPELIEHLQKTGVLQSTTIVKALSEIDRADFVPDIARDLAYADVALPIGEGQTISQPYTVVFMLEQLGVRVGDKILEIGHGSCWQTALLADIVGEKGLVYAFELLPTLCYFGDYNLKKYPHLSKSAQLLCSSGQDGHPLVAPFDGIICASQVDTAPDSWRDQLKIGGRAVYPTQGGITVETKYNETWFEKKEYRGFAFVPFVSK